MTHDLPILVPLEEITTVTNLVYILPDLSFSNTHTHTRTCIRRHPCISLKIKGENKQWIWWKCSQEYSGRLEQERVLKTPQSTSLIEQTWHWVPERLPSHETAPWCEPHFDMWGFRWASRCVNTRLPGLSMIFNNRIWSSSQHFIQALNLKVEPRDLKKFMIPQTQGIFPHDRYLRTKSVKPALCGLALFPELQLRGASESQVSCPGWGPSRRAGGWCPGPPPTPIPAPGPWRPCYHPLPSLRPDPRRERASPWVPRDKDSVSTWKSNCWHTLLFPQRKSVQTNPLQTEDSKLGSLWWQPAYMAFGLPYEVVRLPRQDPVRPTIPPVLPVLSGPSRGSEPPSLGDSSAFPHTHPLGAQKTILWKAPLTGSWGMMAFCSRKRIPIGQVLLS